MPTPIEYADSCLWEFCCIQRKVGKGYYFIIATMVQEDPGNCRELCGKALRQAHFGIVPFFVSTKVWRGKQKQSGNRFLDLLLGEIFQQNRTTHRVSH